MTASSKAKAAGTTVGAVSKKTDVHTNTLRDWCRDKPKLYAIVLKGCKPRKTATCTWVYEEYDFWESTCGQGVRIENGGPQENGMNYCSHCGNKLIEELR